jgi:hypothetical protein
MNRLLLMILGIVFSLKAFSQEFTAEGELTYSVFKAKNVLSYQLYRYFFIKRNGDKWLIQTRNLSAKDTRDPADILYREAGCDGTNIFWLIVQDTNKLSKGVSLNMLGTVTEGIVPIMDERATLVSPIWLAYASLPYFNGVKDGKVKHIEYVSDDVFRKEAVQAEWKVNPAASEFVQSATYHSDGMAVYHTPYGENKVAPYPKPYDQGFIGARFYSDDYTNMGTLSIPTHFELDIIMPAFDATNGFAVASSVQGKLTKISPAVDIETFYPKISAKALITDKRFQQKGVEDFNYIIEAEQPWLQVGDPKLDKLLAYYERNYAKLLSPKPPMKPATKRLIIVPFIIVNAILIAFLLFRLRSQKSS